MNWYLKALKKYAAFSGRAQRKEYWYFILFNLIAIFIVGIIEVAIGADRGALQILYWLAVLLPGIGVSVRRLHDTNRSGWWLLIAFVPLIGTIVLIVFYCQDSDAGDNRFGPNPKAQAA
jgi:uncharacterized membrane protein YhaH (DUF805 family)